jgi:ABC-type Na+ efflux pump permease subunit
MFDNLREEASKPFYEEEAKFQPATDTESSIFGAPSSRRILGMTAVQRFVIAFMFFLAVCIIGAMALLVTGKIGF